MWLTPCDVIKSHLPLLLQRFRHSYCLDNAAAWRSCAADIFADTWQPGAYDLLYVHRLLDSESNERIASRIRISRTIPLAVGLATTSTLRLRRILLAVIPIQ